MKKLSAGAWNLLRCPVCHSKLVEAGTQLECVNPQCRGLYPLVDRVPVLINEDRSVFSKIDLMERKSTYARPVSRFQQVLTRVLPDISLNVLGLANYRQVAKLLLARNPRPRVLVVGGRVVGGGMKEIIQIRAIEFVDTDVALGPRTQLVCDAHDLPFADCSFDGVIIQAVLESVVDPYRCVEEIHRVLQDGGLVYAETPFMQQVHAGRYDYTRFTHRGHRRLFRRFNEVSSGAVCGPGMALAWSCQYFLLSFVKSAHARLAVRTFSRLTLFWLKYLDYYLINKPAALDAASGIYFLGTKNSTQVLSDKDLLLLYQD
jgi:SAM-dependent methyltransferase